MGIVNWADVMKLLASIFLQVAAVLLAAWVLPGVTLDGFVPAIWLVIVLVPLNYIIKPILHVLSLPITVLTLGLFALVINGGMILLASAIVSGFGVDGFLWAVIFSIVLGLVTTILQKLFGGDNN